MQKGVNGKMGYNQLSKRQIEVLSAMARGETDAEIAQELHIEQTTIRSHFEAIKNKLGINEREKNGVSKRIIACKEYWKNNIEKLSEL